MKNVINKLLIVLLCFFLVACDEIFTEPIPKLKEGINLVLGNQYQFDSTQIDFYDRSSHIIYFKERLNINTHYLFGTKYWFTDNKEVFYEGLYGMSSGGCSCLYESEYLVFSDWKMPNFLMELMFSRYPRSKFLEMEDPRDSTGIMVAFEKYGKLRTGLSSEIVDVVRNSSTQVEITIRITNNDTINYYYPDPEKMGNELFHSFTDGLELFQNDTIYKRNNVVREGPRGTLDMDWLTKIEKGTSRTYKLKYDQFDSLTTGEYLAIFTFPGLNFNSLSRADIDLEDGRIWIGEIELGTKVNL